MLPFRVHREPAFQDTLALVEYFLDRPEGGEGENAEQGWDEDVADEQWTDDAQDTQKKEHPPAAGAPIVFSLDDHRMKKPDDEKGTDANDDSFHV